MSLPAAKSAITRLGPKVRDRRPPRSHGCRPAGRQPRGRGHRRRLRTSYSTGSGSATTVDVSGGSTQTAKITGLRSGKTYSIGVASLEGSGNSRSSFSPRISIKTR